MYVADRVPGTLATGDFIVLVVYFIIVLAVGIWSSWSSSSQSIKGYFLASRNMHFLLIGASLFASNIGSGHFVGLAGSAAKNGIAVAGFELNAVFILIMLGWLFVPVYIASGVFTMPEYLRKRFGGRRIRVYLSILALLLYIFTKISADLFAGAIFINVAMKGYAEVGLYPSIIFLLLIACILTVTGGLNAVVWTDAVQVVIMVIGSTVLMIMGFIEIGGYTNLIHQYFLSIPASNFTGPGLGCAELPREDSMNLLRDSTTGDLPWSGMVFGLTINSIWYWCTDQVIVQRALAAKNITHAKAGTVLAGWLKFLPMWLIVFPGMISRVLFRNQIACSDPDACKEMCGISAGCSNTAYPLLVMTILPHGLKGLMLACMLSALMSSLTSIFNSAATIFTIDVYPFIRRKASETELVIVGKIFVIVLVVISVLWIPIIQKFQDAQLFDYIQAVTSYLAPPVCAVFVLAIFVPRVNEDGAFWGLIMGFLVGMVKFILDMIYTAPGCSQPDTRPLLIAGVHYLHFAILLFGITLIVTLVISAMTPPPSPKQLYRLTFWNRHDGRKEQSSSGTGTTNGVSTGPGDTGPPGTERSISTISYHTADQSVNAAPSTNTGEQKPRKEPTGWKKWMHKICGTGGGQSEQETEEQRNARMEEMISLDENPFWKRFCEVQAILVMAVAVFFWVFYA